MTHWTIHASAVLPVTNNLTRRGAVRNRTILALVAHGHMVQYILHCVAMRERALCRLKSQHGRQKLAQSTKHTATFQALAFSTTTSKQSAHHYVLIGLLFLEIAY